MIYILVFIVSIIFLKLANSFYPSKKLYLLFLLIAAFFPAFLAGCRDFVIGRDTLSYIEIFDDACLADSFSQLVLFHARIEKGFLLMTFLVSRFTSSSAVYLAICHAFIILPAFTAFLKLKDCLIPSVSALIFLLLFYNESLNLTRQFISISFIILSVPYWINKKPLIASVLVIIATSFHTTALLGLLFPFYLWTLKRFSVRRYLLLYVVSVLGIGVLFFNLSNWGLLSFMGDDSSENIYHYINDNFGGMSVSYSTMIVYLFVLISLIIPSFNANNPIISSFFMMAVFAFLTVFLSPISRPLYRISLDFSAYCSISLPFLFSYSKKSGHKYHSLYKWILFIFLLLLIVYWVFSVIIRGSNDTFPYSSRILSL